MKVKYQNKIWEVISESNFGIMVIQNIDEFIPKIITVLKSDCKIITEKVETNEKPKSIPKSSSRKGIKSNKSKGTAKNPRGRKPKQ